MKGQISFDFVMALIIALILIQTLMSFSGNFLANQEKTGIRMQEKQIGNEIHRVLLYAGTLKGSTNLKITHQVPKIFLSGPTGNAAEAPIPCDITITETDINVVVTPAHYPNIPTGSNAIFQTITNTSGMTLPQTNCGKTITITKANTG